MIKKQLFISTAFFFYSVSSWPQASAGPKLFLNFSNVVGGENTAGNKFKLGFSAGVYLKLDLSDLVSLQPEFLYSTRGFRYTTADSNLKHSLRYIDFPLLIGIQIGENGSMNFGPQIGFLINDKIKGVVSNSSSSVNIDSDNVYGYNTTEYAIAFGGGYMFRYNLLVSVRGMYGLTKLYLNGDLAHNFAFGLSVAYTFGGSSGSSGRGQDIIYKKM